jgi:hypothetical protein
MPEHRRFFFSIWTSKKCPRKKNIPGFTSDLVPLRVVLPAATHPLLFVQMLANEIGGF